MAERVVVTGLQTEIIHWLTIQLSVDTTFHRPRLPLGTFRTDAVRMNEHLPTKGVVRYVFAAGFLQPTHISHQTFDQIGESLAVNLVSVVQMCEHVLHRNPQARICVVGSASGECGSYDTTYALAKAGLHRYVETRQLQGPDQQLVCVAPGIIENSGMTWRRKDTERLDTRREAHPKRRFLDATEVARMIRFLLWEDRGYTTNTVIHMQGDVRCRS